MKFRVGACALLVCLAGCTAETPGTNFGDKRGAASSNALAAQRLPSVQAGREASRSVANAPDRGALISYKNKGVAAKREGAYTWYPIAISEAHALKAVVDGVMTIPSPDGTQAKVRYERHVEHPDGNWTWIGRVIGGDQKQEAILTFGEKAVYGSIPQKTGAPLSLQTRGGQLYAVQTDPSKVKNPNSRTDMMVPPAQALRSALLASAPKAQVLQSAAETKAASAANTIDVAIGYTSGFATVHGSQSAAVTRLVFLVEIGNQAFANSLINGALRLVNAVQIDYTDTTDNETALAELTGKNRNNGTVTIPASLVPLRSARDQYGADLAVLVRRFYTPENRGCGIAWLNGSGQTPINPAVDDDYGFAVISDGNDTEGANSYFCADETLVHELGHLMGSAHDRDNSRINPDLAPGGTNQLYGRYPYSFGMKTTEANGNFYTIMSYGDNNQNFYRTFSNPLVLKCGPAGNLACGVAEQTDNARSLNQTIPVVATFRSTVVPLGKYVRNDVTGDAKSELFWRSGADIVYWVMNGPNMASSVYAGNLGAAGLVPIAAGDFNIDGAGDLIFDFRSGSNNYLRQWISNGQGGFTASTLAYAGAWTPFGAADIDGDGKSELLWRSGADIAYWVMNGATFVSSVYMGNLGDVDFKLVASGDFNKDGKADLIFDLRKPWGNYLRKWIANTQGGGYTVYTEQYSGTWTPFGAADIDADGKSELLWRSGSDIAYWVVNGPTFVSSVYAGSLGDADFIPAGIGDYNADGRADLIFDLRKPWGNYLRKWIGNPQGGFTVYTEQYSGTWTPFDPSK